MKSIHQINANISKCTLTNVNGIEADILSYGATLTALRIPTKEGKIIDVVVGFEYAEQYVESFEKEGSPYFGAVVGRYAGRIKNGNFILNDQSYQVEKNLNHQHHLPLVCSNLLFFSPFLFCFCFCNLHSDVIHFHV